LFACQSPTDTGWTTATHYTATLIHTSTAENNTQ